MIDQVWQHVDDVGLHGLDLHLDDPEFAHAMAARLDEYLGGAR